MPDTIIEFKNVSKRYFIGEHSIRTLREDAGRFFHRFFGRNGESKKEIWALKDISFKIRRGEAVGIIGANGSGKTTIFKLISRVTVPTRGTSRVYGRVGSLIDLNAGFHPDLTGLENIYLNAAIRGMKRAEIKRQLDKIVSFAEIERFLETPVKHYSGGMRVRLGFSVAVFCPADILLIDEVLAVGDFSFQKKCLDKISELHKDGRSILFVSHDMEKIKEVCPRMIYLSEGKLAMDGDSSVILNKYLQDTSIAKND